MNANGGIHAFVPLGQPEDSATVVQVNGRDDDTCNTGRGRAGDHVIAVLSEASKIQVAMGIN
jgi:hypothetical protein